MTTTMILASLLWVPSIRAHCPPVSGSFSIEVQNLYPESYDWDPKTCKLYLSSLYNCTLVVYDPYDKTSEIVDIPGISNHGVFNYTEYHLDGIDNDAHGGLVYIAATSANAFVASATGNYSDANYTGPNRIIRYDPIEKRILADVSLQHAQQQYQRKTGNLTNGFQDMAENSAGDSFAIGTFGNSIVRIPSNSSQAHLWYTPPDYNIEYGFGGIFTTASDKLVVSDTISGGLVTFDSKARRPRATYVPLQDLPSNYRPLMADGLYAPKKYGVKIALWSDDFNGTSVYRSDDDWETAHFLGLVQMEQTIAAEGGFTTASVEIGQSIFALSEFFQAELPVTTRTSWPIVDITNEVDKFVQGE